MTSHYAINSQLCLRRVELLVHLGWSPEERQQKQSIFLDINITFPTPPLAVETDHLQDSICYATLVQDLQQYLQAKQFRLVEYLTRDIYYFVKSRLAVSWQCCIHLTKYPLIPSLLNGVCFSYGDQST